MTTVDISRADSPSNSADILFILSGTCDIALQCPRSRHTSPRSKLFAEVAPNNQLSGGFDQLNERRVHPWSDRSTQTQLTSLILQRCFSRNMTTPQDSCRYHPSMVLLLWKQCHLLTFNPINPANR